MSLPGDSLFRLEDLEAPIDHPPTDTDPTQGDPVHPMHPPWMKCGQRISYIRNGQRLLGTLELSESQRWAFVQIYGNDRRVTEIEIPDLPTS